MADYTRLLKQRKRLHEHGSTCSTKLHENNSVNSACPSFHKGHMDGLRCMTLATHKMCPLYSGNLKYFIIDSKQIRSSFRRQTLFLLQIFFFFLLWSHVLKDNLSQKATDAFLCKVFKNTRDYGVCSPNKGNFHSRNRFSPQSWESHSAFLRRRSISFCLPLLSFLPWQYFLMSVNYSNCCQVTSVPHIHAFCHGHIKEYYWDKQQKLILIWSRTRILEIVEAVDKGCWKTSTVIKYRYLRLVKCETHVYYISHKSQEFLGYKSCSCTNFDIT